MYSYTGYETPQAMDCYAGYEVATISKREDIIVSQTPKEPRIDLRTLITRDWNEEFQVGKSKA